eukprot:3076647-Rhodomonas_salina.1
MAGIQIDEDAFDEAPSAQSSKTFAIHGEVLTQSFLPLPGTADGGRARAETLVGLVPHHPSPLPSADVRP